MTIVCETYFTGIDPAFDKSIGGIDVYGHLPYDPKRPWSEDHGLTLGKHVDTGKYIAWRRYFTPKRVEIVFTTDDLPELLRFANSETKRFWKDPDTDAPFSEVPCNHNTHRAAFCHFDWAAMHKICQEKCGAKYVNAQCDPSFCMKTYKETTKQ